MRRSLANVAGSAFCGRSESLLDMMKMFGRDDHRFVDIGATALKAAHQRVDLDQP
jgi:hypothetical protein